MPKFKAGDHIIPMDAPTQGDRIVIGTTSHGHVVYEYSCNGDIMVGSAREDKMKLKPTKKEGWINLYRRDGIDRACGGLVFPTEQAAKDYLGRCKLSTIRIEWEE